MFALSASKSCYSSLPFLQRQHHFHSLPSTPSSPTNTPPTATSTSTPTTTTTTTTTSMVSPFPFSRSHPLSPYGSLSRSHPHLPRADGGSRACVFTEKTLNATYRGRKVKVQVTVSPTNQKSTPKQRLMTAKFYLRPRPPNYDDFADHAHFQFDTQLTFLGTASGSPRRHRNVTALMMQFASTGESWMFDCGEGTQHQLMKGRMISKKSFFNVQPRVAVSRVFITHLHGDHTLGLPSVLIKALYKTQVEKVEIYGPIGLRELIKSATLGVTTRGWILSKLVVHELRPEKKVPSYVSRKLRNESEKDFVIGKNGGVILETDTHIVRAAALKHTVLCYGYVVERKKSNGHLDANKLTALGYPPSPLYKKLKDGDITELDGIPRSEFLTADTRGYKVVILGDTCDTRDIEAIAQNCDLLVHEATYLEMNKSRAQTRLGGHSTAKMAGEAANRMNARNLIVTHFATSQHLDEETERDRNFSHRKIERSYGHLAASEAAAVTKNCPVFHADDFMCVGIGHSKLVENERSPMSENAKADWTSVDKETKKGGEQGESEEGGIERLADAFEGAKAKESKAGEGTKKPAGGQGVFDGETIVPSMKQLPKEHHRQFVVYDRFGALDPTPAPSPLDLESMETLGGEMVVPQLTPGSEASMTAHREARKVRRKAKKAKQLLERKLETEELSQFEVEW